MALLSFFLQKRKKAVYIFDFIIGSEHVVFKAGTINRIID